MIAPRKKKAAKARARRKRTTKKRLPKIPPQLQGLPAAESVREVVEFVSPQKVRYTILKTTEMDAYDRPSIAPRKPNKKRAPR